VPHREAGATVVHVLSAQPRQRGASERVRTIQLLHEQRRRLFDELGVAEVRGAEAQVDNQQVRRWLFDFTQGRL
jgi:hypothetical protein